MIERSAVSPSEYTDLFCCPGCGGELEFGDDSVRCLGCNHSFGVSDGIPLLFWPTDPSEDAGDYTETVKAFYEETPFPHYDDFDSIGSLAEKARQGVFARMLDEHVPPGARVIECGCGTGQLSNFLSITNRTVFGTDICLHSLRLGNDFAREQGLEHVRFVQQNLFRPVFKPESFDLVISNGVLLTTADPFRGFESIARLVKPGGYILVGLYNTYGRLITDARRILFRLTGDRFLWLDPVLRNKNTSDAKKRAWMADQYLHPHESKHSIGEAMGWLRKTGFSFVRSLPHGKPFRPFSAREDLFRPQDPGTPFDRFFVQLGMIFTGSREGGFFIVIGRKPPTEGHLETVGSKARPTAG